jgi:hypothetical protein
MAIELQGVLQVAHERLQGFALAKELHRNLHRSCRSCRFARFCVGLLDSQRSE